MALHPRDRTHTALEEPLGMELAFGKRHTASRSSWHDIYASHLNEQKIACLLDFWRVRLRLLGASASDRLKLAAVISLSLVEC